MRARVENGHGRSAQSAVGRAPRQGEAHLAAAAPRGHQDPALDRWLPRHHLAKLGYIEEDELTAFLSKQYGVPSINLSNFEIDPEVLKILPEEVVGRHQVLPLHRAGNTLIIAMSDPSNIDAIDDVKFITNFYVEVVVASDTAIAEAINRYYTGPRATDTRMTARLEALHPVLTVRDVAQSIRFYESLGFRERFRDSPLEPRYAVVRRDDIELHLQWHDAVEWTHGFDRPTYRFVVDDVDALFRELWQRDLDRTDVMDTPRGTREFHVLDPDGNGLQFYRER
jgi:catechol 2,3-dioxygenase-like lactoylglutathione lyase family enzyme